VENSVSNRLRDLTYVPQMLPELLLADLGFVAGAVGDSVCKVTRVEYSGWPSALTARSSPREIETGW
jgi:hypothetical protein